MLDPKIVRISARLGSAAMILGILLYGGYQLGTYLDHRFTFAPWGTVGCVLIGCVLGMAYLIILITREGG